MLHRAHDGKLEAVSDVVPTDGFYDDRRIRVHSPDLYRVYDLLYFRDERRITKEVLSIVGMQGLTALWCDDGTMSATKMVVRAWCGGEETRLLGEWVTSLGYPPSHLSGSNRRGRMEFRGEVADRLARDLRALVPRCKRPTLRR